MRISTNTLMETSLVGINESYRRYGEAQQRIATGKKLNRPSDDPTGTAHAMGLRSAMGHIEQFQRNITDANGFMATTDVALSQAVVLVREARSLAIQSATDTITQDQRAIIANQLTATISQIGQLGNSTHGSRFVFGGQLTTKPPFVPDGGGFRYEGGTSATADNTLTVEIFHADTVVINHTGDQLLTPTLDALKNLKSHIEGGQISAISREDLAALDNVLQGLLSARAETGVKIQRLTATSSRLALSSENFTELLSKIEDADYTKAVVDLKTAELTYQGALTAGAHGISRTLLDFLK